MTGSISASPAVAAADGVWWGTPVTLYWDVQLPTSCTASGPITVGGVPVGPSGSMVVTRLTSRYYPLQVGSRQIANVKVTTILPPAVRITADTQEQRELFVQAAETANKTVVLKDDLELNLTQWSQVGIHLKSGVTIVSEAPPLSTASFLGGPPPGAFTPGLARDSRHLGPKLFTTSRPSQCLLCIDQEDNIKLRGFRFFGPDLAMTDGSGRGMIINAAKNIELDRLEVAGFSLVGVSVQDLVDNGNGTPRNNDYADVLIHDSFFHHNQRAPGGDGYGVETTHGGRALIRHNVFDFNRHAIMSGGQTGSGYKAEENLILKGGGFHEGFAGVSWHTQIFDVHGSDNCFPVVSWIDDHLLDCGLAGGEHRITGNAFQYTAGYAFKLRGIPEVGAYVNDNVFAHTSLDDALHQNESGLYRWDNALGQDTFGKYGVCDFDGDGIDDLFLPTGRTWWFSSGGKFHWTFLGSHREELSGLGLGDFNRDGRCDVLRTNQTHLTFEISSGGTGPWTALPGNYNAPMSELRFYDFNGDGYTDIFQRAPGGQWYVYFPPDVVPHPLQRSDKPLAELRFGDLDGDRKTDVLAISGGVWSWSRSGVDPWLPRNSLYTSLNDVVAIANVDGVPGDDVVRVTNVSLTGGRLEFSSAGDTAWATLSQVTWPSWVQPSGIAKVYEPLFFAGQFNPLVGDTLLVLDSKDRFTTQIRAGQTSLSGHSLYAH